jgi:16S rRNA A1518/A1519 N6-dimethyltransferase RsmA/KsgA/DIM1 with predicted DNA glycosylase/AP lyase activity
MDATTLQQHDLRPEAAQQVVGTAGVRAGETVVEVGPGLGGLTSVLLAAGARVHAIELDPVRVTGLRRRFAGELADGRLSLIQGDARRLSPRLSGPWRVVANPPFQLTAELVRGWLLMEAPPAAIDLVLQREAADKLTGGELGHTRSSALATVAGAARRSLRLARDATDPPSRVDLAVWSFRRAASAPPAADLRAVDALLAIAFAGPRTMAEALRGTATGIQIRRQGTAHGYAATDHPRQVAAPAWLDFARLLRMCGKLKV